MSVALTYIFLLVSKEESVVEETDLHLFYSPQI